MWEPGLPVGPAGTGRRGSGSCCGGAAWRVVGLERFPGGLARLSQQSPFVDPV